MSLPSWAAATVSALAIAAVLTPWLGTGRRSMHALVGAFRAGDVARWARGHGWSYARRAQLDLGLGVPFDGGSGCTDVVRGTLDGRDFTAFAYEHTLQAVAILLPGVLPFLEVRPRALDDDLGLHWELPIGVESDEFGRRFEVVANDRRYASELLHPRLLERLLAGPELSWRIRGDVAVAWRDGVLDPAFVEAAVGLLGEVADGVPPYVWAERSTPPSSRPDRPPPDVTGR